ncbi:hypothetical protein Q7P37_009745 [Cladosporium fusiforme]
MQRDGPALDIGSEKHFDSCPTKVLVLVLALHPSSALLDIEDSGGLDSTALHHTLGSYFARDEAMLKHLLGRCREMKRGKIWHCTVVNGALPYGAGTSPTMRILMLHGYAQNGNTFCRKTCRLVERIRELHPDANFSWPDGPVKLRTNDIPGFEGKSDDSRDQEGPDLRAWFDLRYAATIPPGLPESLMVIADVLRREGPFQGIIAFSQGTLLAAMVASLLQGDARRIAHRKALGAARAVVQYPCAFQDLVHPPFKFGVLYAGRVGRGRHYDWLYENPSISTPFCLVSGKWDPMIEADEQEAAVGRLIHDGQKSTVIVHKGGHFVPMDRDSNERVVGFISEAMHMRSEDPPHQPALVDPVALQKRLEMLEKVCLG